MSNWLYSTFKHNKRVVRLEGATLIAECFDHSVSYQMTREEHSDYFCAVFFDATEATRDHVAVELAHELLIEKGLLVFCDGMPMAPDNAAEYLAEKEENERETERHERHYSHQRNFI